MAKIIDFKRNIDQRKHNSNNPALIDEGTFLDFNLFSKEQSLY